MVCVAILILVKKCKSGAGVSVIFQSIVIKNIVNRHLQERYSRFTAIREFVIDVNVLVIFGSASRISCNSYETTALVMGVNVVYRKSISSLFEVKQRLRLTKCPVCRSAINVLNKFIKITI